MGAERLQKILAGRGLASRREAETWIREGRVRVNSEVVAELGAKADPDVDRVEVDGKPLPAERRPLTVVLRKPRGYVTTVRDPHAERTVMDLLAGLDRRVYPVGRLDLDTRGVLLLTDDGDLAHSLLHPSRGVEKVYEVTACGDLTREKVEELGRGVELRDGHVTRPARVSDVRPTAEGFRFRLTLKEGHKRQVREMVKAVGGRVLDLTRVSFGGITAEGLDEGQWRALTSGEVEGLRRLASGKGEGPKGARGAKGSGAQPGPRRGRRS